MFLWQDFLRVPSPHRVVTASAGGDPLTVWAETEALVPHGMSSQRENLLTGFCVPDLEPCAPIGCDNPPAIWTETYSPDLTPVPLELECFLAGLNVPHVHTYSTRNQVSAVRGEAHCVDLTRVSHESMNFFPRLHIPHF